MNFLAHLWLAERAQADLAGAVLGDWLRGPVPADWPVDLAHSVRLHRHLDACTDRDPVVVAARARFPEGQRRYAGIFLDLLCDHLLAARWQYHHPQTLPSFSDHAAQAVHTAADWFVQAGGPAPDAAEFSRLLQSYTLPEGFEWALERTALRLRKPQGLRALLADWPRHAQSLRPELPALLERLAADAVRYRSPAT